MGRPDCGEADFEPLPLLTPESSYNSVLPMISSLKGHSMRFLSGSTFAIAIALLAPALVSAQGQGAAPTETSRSIAGGGISAPGWTGAVDANAVKAGQTVKDAKLTQEGDVLHVTTGPAVTYWNPANKASGDYTVSATFTEPKYMNLNTHPHPYGIMIGGNNMGTPEASYLYCAAYGNGNFIVRGFGPEPFQMNGRRGGESDAVHKAAGPGQPVTQKIALSVKGDKVECAINGTVVASYDKSELVSAGKLKSTDGVYGIRFAHNTEGTVSDLSMTKQ